MRPEMAHNMQGMNAGGRPGMPGGGMPPNRGCGQAMGGPGPWPSRGGGPNVPPGMPQGGGPGGQQTISREELQEIMNDTDRLQRFLAENPAMMAELQTLL